MAIAAWIAAVLIGLRLVADLALGALNRAEVRRHASRPPAAAVAVMDAPTYARSVEYTLAKSRFDAMASIYDTLVTAYFILGGVLPPLFARIVRLGAPDAVWSRAIFILAAGGLLALASLPVDWWNQFRIEQKFGFNKSTPGLWILDKVKGALVTIAIGFPLLWVLLSLVRRIGRYWWLWGFAVLFGFQLVMLVLYPKIIVPLFNKLRPLPPGELRERLLSLGDRTGFRTRSIDVIDGSKRSGHSNAYFTGFGRFRRIVIFDTLIAQLAPEELEAVLAHEIGHYRRGHVPKMIAFSAASLLAGFWILARLAAAPAFNRAFGFAPGEMAPSLLLFILIGGAVTFWFTPLANVLLRRYEYEADAFARDALGTPAAMIAALRKLAEKNLANLTPHPLFSAFFHSHPTIVERERALAANGA